MVLVLNLSNNLHNSITMRAGQRYRSARNLPNILSTIVLSSPTMSQLYPRVQLHISLVDSCTLG